MASPTSPLISPVPCSNPGVPHLAPVVCLHGFGSTKEDGHDLILHPACQARSVLNLAYDVPGCGESFCSDLSRISIPFLVRTAEALLDGYNFPPHGSLYGRG